MLKSWGWGGGGGVVAHKILVTSPEAKYLCYLFWAFLGFGLWTGTWPRACQFENWPGIKYLQRFGFHWMTLVFGKYSQYFQHPTCEDILSAGIKILGITTKLSDGSLCEQTISLVQNLKDPFCQTVQRMTICSIHYDIWWMICGWNPEKSRLIFIVAQSELWFSGEQV